MKGSAKLEIVLFHILYNEVPIFKKEFPGEINLKL